MPFGDLRIENRYTSLLSRMSGAPGVILRQLSTSHAEEAAYYRLLDNARFGFEDILRNEGLKQLDQISGGHVLAISDTTEINLDRRAAHYFDSSSGYLSDNRSRGMIAHPTIALAADSLCVLGLSDLLLWDRPKSKGKKTRAQRDRLAAEEKESYKWYLGISGSGEVLASADRITYVFDREADILGLFSHLDQQKHDFVIRIKYDRKLEKQAEKPSPATIREALAQSKNRHEAVLEVRGEETRKRVKRQPIKGRKKRQAQMEICYTQVQFPGSYRPYYVVDACEKPASVPQDESPIHWRLLTSHPVESLEEALTIIGWYKARWIIEELFRIIKSQGFQLETIQLRSVSSVRKMIAITLIAGLQILQLNLAKIHSVPLPIETAFTPKQILLLKALSDQLEGKTEKLKNPYQHQELRFAHWVLARLGGWKGYQSKRPPGPITLLRGATKFTHIFQAYSTFELKDVWEP